MMNLMCLALEELHEQFHLGVNRVRQKNRLPPPRSSKEGAALLL
jgi:hypothetical protein